MTATTQHPAPPCQKPSASRGRLHVLLIHGKEDWRADFKQAKRMRAALEAAGKQFEWVALSHEGHGIFDEETRRDVYERVLQFLDKNLAPLPAPRTS